MIHRFFFVPSGRATVTILAWALLVTSAPRRAAAQAAADPEAIMREASKHYEQGVSFYGEADYRSALVEFKRAAALAPSAAALYNIGETEYQLRDYAAAIRTFERYLSAVGPLDAHRAEVENNIKLLRTRVARLTINTVPVGADVFIDDQPVGRTPFAAPLLVNVGHLKIVASAVDRLSPVQFVDLAAEDNVVVSLELYGVPSAAVAGNTGETLAPNGLVRGAAETGPHGSSFSWRPIGWAGAGVAAVGAITFGLLARREADRLDSARQAFQPSADTLDHLSSRTTTYAVLADTLAVAAIALGVVTFTTSTGHATAGTTTGLTVGPGSLAFRGTFP